MDYKKLLQKYMDYIRQCEGVDFITAADQSYRKGEAGITDAEWAELVRLAGPDENPIVFKPNSVF